MRDINDLSVEELSLLPEETLKAAIVSGKIPTDISGEKQKLPDPGLIQGLKVGAEQGVGLGFRPALRGLGGGLGYILGSNYEGLGLSERLSKMKKDYLAGYDETRKEALAEEQAVKENRPISSLIGNVAGSALTLPFSGLKALGAAKTGAIMGGIQGLGQSVSEDKNLEDTAINVGTGAALGGVFSKGLEQAGKGLQYMSGKKDNLSAIKEAAARAGIPTTVGMESGAKVIQGAESTLEQSPTLGGYLASRGVKATRKAFNGALEDITKDASSLSAYEVGSSVKSGILANVNERAMDPGILFEKLKVMTKDIPLSDKSLKTIAKNIQEIREVALVPDASWSGKARSYAQSLMNAKSVDDIITIRKIVGKDLGSTMDKNELSVLSNVYEKLTRLENNSIMRGAISAARSKKEGSEIGLEMVQESVEAKKLWKGLIADVNKFAEKTGIKKEGISPVLSEVESMTNEKFLNKFFSKGNLDGALEMKKQFPEQFETLRQARIGEIRSSAIGPKGDLSVERFLTQVKKYSKEELNIIFGPERTQKIQDVKTLYNSFPDMIGKSGTPEGMAYLGMMDPLAQAKSAIGYIVYSSPGIVGGAGKAVEKSAVPVGSAIERRMNKLKEGK